MTARILFITFVAAFVFNGCSTKVDLGHREPIFAKSSEFDRCFRANLQCINECRQFSDSLKAQCLSNCSASVNRCYDCLCGRKCHHKTEYANKFMQVEFNKASQPVPFIKILADIIE